MPALGWLTDSTAAAATRATNGTEFDVAELLDGRGTVFMLGAEESQVAPLVTALTGHIAREARRIAGGCPAGRLDPPLTLALDEAALICPIPLDNWTADMGGRGVTIHLAVQSRAQLRHRWGDTGAAAILNNTATILLFGGTRDPEDLAAYSTLSGERDEEVPTHDAHGSLESVSYRRVPVLSAGQIAQLPAGRVVIIRRGMPAAIGTVQMAWRRRDVRRARRVAEPVLAPVRVVTPDERPALSAVPLCDRNCSCGGRRFRMWSDMGNCMCRSRQCGSQYREVSSLKSTTYLERVRSRWGCGRGEGGCRCVWEICDYSMDR